MLVMYTFNWVLTAFRSESYIGSATALADAMGISAACSAMICMGSLYVALTQVILTVIIT